MKLQKITLCDFRAFPGPGEYCFDLGRKNHLLIYGENGSGKTSVFKAIREFFDNRTSATSFLEQKNCFSDHVQNIPLICGKVELCFDPHPQQIKTWSFQPQGQPDNRPSTDQTVTEVCRRKGLLDYLSLVKVNYAEKDRSGNDRRPNLFSLLIEDLLFDFPVTISGGRSVKLGQLWDDLNKYIQLNPTHRGYNLQTIQDKLQQFNGAALSATQILKGRCDSILTQYFKHPVALTFVYENAIYRQHRKVGARRVDLGHLSFDLHFLGRSFTKYEEVLNEAKLSAVALAVYFSSLIEGIPQGSSGYPRILVLDDVLIGLDMSNRLPVLEILEKEFADKGWQLILLTHDKVWYDYAAHAATGIDWQCYELYADFCFDAQGDRYELPCLRKPDDGAGNHIKRAHAQLSLHDDKAAAMYARTAYEQLVSKYCNDRHLQMPFYKDVAKIKSEMFLQKVEDDLNVKLAATTPVPTPDELIALNAAKSACDDIRLHRQQALNPLSHAHVVPLTKPEVELAIRSVETLCSALGRIPK
jgi:energy-coupling factor transporter ATP-binding protein EcfA2